MDNKTRYKLVFFTGAGISKEAGIPTFDEVEGIRDKLTRDYAIHNPEGYKQVIQDFVDMIGDKEPTPAHYAIAKFDVPVLTMNVDKLHQKAGSKNVIELHGQLPDKVVLYGDPAPEYQTAINIVKSLKYDDSYFIVIGTSFYTMISNTLLKYAKQRMAKVIIINDNASTRVPKLLSNINLD